jgi:hypothetical protein
MQACESSRRGDVAESLLLFMTERNVKIEQRTLESCVRACCSSGHWEKAVKQLNSVLNAAEYSFIEPALFDLLSSCLGHAGQWERALEVASLKHDNDCRALRASLIDEWRTFKQQNEDVFSLCRAALCAQSGFPHAFRELMQSQTAMAAEFRLYSRDFEALASIPIALQSGDDEGAENDSQPEGTSFTE